MNLVVARKLWTRNRNRYIPCFSQFRMIFFCNLRLQQKLVSISDLSGNINIDGIYSNESMFLGKHAGWCSQWIDHIVSLCNKIQVLSTISWAGVCYSFLMMRESIIFVIHVFVLGFRGNFRNLHNNYFHKSSQMWLKSYNYISDKRMIHFERYYINQ